MAKKLSNLTPSLSVLICTMPERYYSFTSLKESLEKQIEQNKLNGLVEILSDDRMDITIGQKRNNLMQAAKGKFVAFIDDDDDVHTDYLRLIVEAIQNNPELDCIGINGEIIFDKIHHRQWFVSIKYEEWHEKDLIFYRTPNHLSPIKREIAVKCAYPDSSFGEDRFFSDLIFPLLKNEVVIETPLYIYHHSSKSDRLVFR
jgi:glycosyltransferase involved in cell wall biosynthesis